MSLHQHALLFFFAIGCSDYRFGNDEKNLGADDGIPPRKQEYVTGMPDPDACDDWVGTLSNEVAINDECALPVLDGTLDAVLEWQILQFSSYPEYSQAVMTPLIGQLTDDNGDGVIDGWDTPDIVVITDDNGAAVSEGGVLRILSGDGAGELRSVFRADHVTDTATLQTYPYRYANAALGDIDSDGEPEIITIARTLEGPGKEEKDSGGQDEEPETGLPNGKDTDDDEPNDDDPILPPPPTTAAANLSGEGCTVIAYNTSLEVEWLGSGLDLPCGGHAPALADLEGDGSVEVVVGPYILDGATGVVRGVGSGDVGRFRAYSEMGLHSIIADLDVDGTQEVIAGRAVYNPQGDLICQGTDGFDGFTAAADLDMDGQGEFLVVGNGQATLFEADCAVSMTWTLPGGGSGGPPTIADYDGDGTPEVGMADASTYSVYEASGEVLWSMPVTDASSHTTGSVVFDFEGDGYPEVVYGDEITLWIFDGRDGTVRYESSLHESRTLHEYPTIADIDGDGSAEIITVNGGSHYGSPPSGVYVYGSQSDGWQGARQIWNQHAYAITNINDDLSIPSPVTSNWPLYNNFRSGDVNPYQAGASPDAIPVLELCASECPYNRLVASVRVGNQGPAALRGGLAVVAYSEEPDGSFVMLDRAMTTQVALEGRTSEVLMLDLDLEVIGTNPVHIVVDANNSAAECDETNNTVTLTALDCE